MRRRGLWSDCLFTHARLYLASIALFSATKTNQNTFDNPPTGTELRIIQELYSVGEGAPAIRAQVLGFRMSLDVADELENMGIYDASQVILEAHWCFISPFSFLLLSLPLSLSFSRASSLCNFCLFFVRGLTLCSMPISGWVSVVGTSAEESKSKAKFL